MKEKSCYQRLLSFAVMININLVVFNLLPIPPLDGGKTVLYLFEKIHPKALKLHIPVTIAEKCPVNKTLKSNVTTETKLI